MSAKQDGKCCFCKRKATVCWVMPCLALQTALDTTDEPTMRRWVRRAGVEVRTKTGRKL